MSNPHIIVGEPRRCVCGSYDGKSICCADVIRALSNLERYAKTHLRPSALPPTGEDIMLIVTVMKPLFTECDI